MVCVSTRGLPNRSAAKHTVNGVSCYVWDGDPTSRTYWTTRDAVETLLAMAAPIDGAGDVIFNWTPSNLAALPNFDSLVDEPTHGTSYLHLLRALVPRHRLLGFGCRFGAGNTVVIAFDTFTATAISLKDSGGVEVGTIPANSAKDSIVITADQSAVASLTTEASNVADQVIATGGRRKSVFSISKTDGSGISSGSPRWKQSTSRPPRRPPITRRTTSRGCRTIATGRPARPRNSATCSPASGRPAPS